MLFLYFIISIFYTTSDIKLNCVCGIFGNFNINEANIFYDLGKYSETRGKEASGFIAVSSSQQVIKSFQSLFLTKL